MATLTTVSSKGQTVIPKQVRKALGLAPGSKIEFVIEDGTARIIPVRKPKPSSVSAGFGMLKYQGPALKVDEMDVATLLRKKKNK